VLIGPVGQLIEALPRFDKCSSLEFPIAKPFCKLRCGFTDSGVGGEDRESG
jgi:hypothetical protein